MCGFNPRYLRRAKNELSCLALLTPKAPQTVYTFGMTDNAHEPKTLEELAKEYYSVRRAEFSLTDEETQTILDNAKKRFMQLEAAAIETMAYLMEHADSDAVRWNVAKYVHDNVIAKTAAEDTDMDKLLRDLIKAHPTA